MFFGGWFLDGNVAGCGGFCCLGRDLVAFGDIGNRARDLFYWGLFYFFFSRGRRLLKLAVVAGCGGEDFVDPLGADAWDVFPFFLRAGATVCDGFYARR